MKRIAEDLRPPLLLACDDASLPDMSLALPDTLDELTLAYVTDMRIPFDELRRAAGQLAGMLVLAMSGGRGVAGHPMLDLAGTAQRAAGDAIRGRLPPPRAVHHHMHLKNAANRIADALRAARLQLRADDASTDAILAPLRAGYRELQWAAAALPGFEVVAFSQGCCARHTPPAQPGSAGIIA